MQSRECEGFRRLGTGGAAGFEILKHRSWRSRPVEREAGGDGGGEALHVCWGWWVAAGRWGVAEGPMGWRIEFRDVRRFSRRGEWRLGVLKEGSRSGEAEETVSIPGSVTSLVEESEDW